MGRRRTCLFTTTTLLSVLFLSFFVCLCSSRDTITFNQPLKDGDLLTSNGTSFFLGFFSPGNSVGKRYVGIWYQPIPDQRVVWVANRDNPVNGTSGVLFIDSTGNLVIQDKKTNVSVWNTSLSFPATGTKAYSAQLQDTGNLVLYHDPDRKATTWQSFDYPTNTRLPLMKLGLDKKRGLKRVLTSWKSSDDPGTGQYAFGLELNATPEVFLYQYKSGTPVYRAGSWNGIGLSGVAKMSNSYVADLHYIENEDEVTMMHTLRNPSMYLTLVVNESGRLDLVTWQEADKKWVVFTSSPKDECDQYAHCGAFSNCNPYNSGYFECTCIPGFEPQSSREWSFGNGTHGCRRNNTDVCHNGEGFIKMTNWKIPDTNISQVNRTIGLKECEELCLKNCSCSGYASANISDGGMGCITWYGDLMDMRQFASGGQDMYIRVSASDLELMQKSKGFPGKMLIVTVAVPVASVVLLLLLCCLLVKIRKGKQLERNSSTRNDQSTHYEGSGMVKHVDETGSSDLLIFDLKTIQSATDNFSPSNKLGQGGFGSVYKGTLEDGELVAVKRLSRTSGQGINEFKNEVTLIAKLQHRNLVRLLGYCIQEGEKILVYEYLPNKALDSFIFDNINGVLLDWKKRFEIILGTARGLLYLHQDSRLKIIHRDLKAGNILLDASMHPKISDFGMARIFGGDQNEANTNRVVGTYGYMSPEYAMEGHFSVKSDVYSFGVLLLEIVTGRKNKNPNNGKSINLITSVWDFWSENRAFDTIDPSLGESYDDRQVLRCIHVGLLCVQSNPDDRPDMLEVIFMLSNETKLPQPNQPGFIFKHGSSFLPSTSTSTLEYQSVNDMSITNIEGR